jgi:NTP pyrophosphatase (non-canonical NTP hydrolase)
MINLQPRILIWANDRGLLSKNNAKNQYIKTTEEVGELGKAILENDIPEIYDAIGDIAVTLIILANQYGTDFSSCIELAYNAIKDRKGKTIDGTFIKD